MIAGLKSYPAMKDSGVPWLGEVPEHWELERAKCLSRKMAGIAGRSRNYHVASISIAISSACSFPRTTALLRFP
jgi:hypothetical protein